MIFVNSLASILGCTVAGGYLFSLKCFSQSLISFALSASVFSCLVLIAFSSLFCLVVCALASISRISLKCTTSEVSVVRSLSWRNLCVSPSNDLTHFKRTVHRFFFLSRQKRSQCSRLLSFPQKGIVLYLITFLYATNQCQNNASQFIQRNSWCSSTTPRRISCISFFGFVLILLLTYAQRQPWVHSHHLVTGIG